MTTPRWLETAFGELWPTQVREVSGPIHNPRIVEYHAVTTLSATEDEVAWCSAFVCWCMERSGIESTRSARARSWIQWGVPGRFPVVGSIVVLTRAGDTSGPEVLDAPGHVGFCCGPTEKNGILVLGGNQGDAVSIDRFPLGQVISFRVPPLVQGGL